MVIFVLASRWLKKHFINGRNIFLALQWCSRYYSSLCATSKKSINPRWPPVVILNYAKSCSETDSESSVTEGQTVYRELNTTANRDHESGQPADKTQWQALTLMDSAIPGAVKPLDHVGTTTHHDHSASSSAHTQGIPRHRPQNEMVAVIDLTARRWHLTVLQTTIFKQLPRNKQSWEF